jgi:hypothetical protein
MVLPKELVQEHVDLFASVSPKEKVPSSPKKKKAFVGDLQSMKELQQLVRGFCALSPEQRDASHQAKAIALFGYPLQQSASGSPVSFSNRKAILQKISPVIELMDKRRVEETKYWEDETECRVEKSRSGKYRYYSIPTNTKVSPQGYENRYMAVLERTAEERFEKSEEWKARLVLPKQKGNNNNNNDNTIEKEQDNKEGESLLEETRSIPIICHDVSMEDESESKNGSDDISETQDLDLNLDSLLDTQPREESASPLNIEDDNDTMDICDMSVSLDLGEAISISFEEEEEPASEQEKQSETREETPPKEAGEPSEDIVGTAAEACVAPMLDDQEDHQKQPLLGPSAEDGPSMLPLPARDGQSKDPDIARAERNLWNSIDAALQEYSREVMIIMQAKRGGQRDDPKAVVDSNNT